MSYNKNLILVTNIIRKLGVPANILGFDYIRSAIMLCITDNSLIHNITTRLYPILADMYKSTSPRVERSIRHAINMSLKRGDIELLKKYFNYPSDNKYRISNSEFIATIADLILIRAIDEE